MQSTKTNLIPITFFRKLLEDGNHQNENKNQEKKNEIQKSRDLPWKKDESHSTRLIKESVSLERQRTP